MAGGDDDLTARLIGLREILRGQIDAAVALSTARMDGMDAARQQYLTMLAEQRSSLQLQIDQRLGTADRLFTLIQEQVDRRIASSEQLGLQRHNDLRDLVLTGQESARAAVQAALDAAKEATSKAETSTAERFRGVNEFRAALTDQTATFVPRTEYDARNKALEDRVAGNADRMGALELQLTSRLDLASGRDAGQGESRTEQRLNISQVIAAISTLAAVLGFILYAVKK